MGLADFGWGVQSELKQMLAERVAEQQYADKMRQQQFENKRQLGSDARAQQGLDQTAQDRQDRLQAASDAKDASNQERANTQAGHIADTVPAGKMLPGSDPAVGRLVTAGYGSLLTPKGITAQAPPSAIANDEPATEMPGTVLNAPTPGGRLFTKGASEKQQQDAATNARAAGALTKGTPEKFRVDGKEVMGSFNSADGTYWHNGEDVTGRAAPIPAASIQINAMNGGGSANAGDFNQSGAGFLDTIPPQWRTTVKKIANYDEDPSKVTSMRGGMRERVMQWVNQVNPEYDATKYSVRGPTRQAFTTGTQGQQITAMNTAIEHLDQLQGASDALQNGTFKPGNAAYNYLRDTFGGAPPSNYDTIKAMVDREVEAVAAKGVPTVSGTAEQKALAGKSASPEQLKGYIDTLIPLMGSKLNALHYQYKQSMGEHDPYEPLTPQAKAILARRGHGGLSSSDQGPQGSEVTVGGFRIRVVK